MTINGMLYAQRLEREEREKAWEQARPYLRLEAPVYTNPVWEGYDDAEDEEDCD